MGGFSFGSKSNPEVSLVGRNDLKFGGFSGNRQISLRAFLSKRSGAGLPKFLIHEANEHNLRILRSWSALSKHGKGAEKRGHGTFGIARTPSV